MLTKLINIPSILHFSLILKYAYASACNCNKFGSIDANCTQYGVCTCKPGVLGVKCDQCPQNRYNLSVGCIGMSFIHELLLGSVVTI